MLIFHNFIVNEYCLSNTHGTAQNRKQEHILDAFWAWGDEAYFFYHVLITFLIQFYKIAIYYAIEAHHSESGE